MYFLLGFESWIYSVLALPLKIEGEVEIMGVNYGLSTEYIAFRVLGKG